MCVVIKQELISLLVTLIGISTHAPILHYLFTQGTLTVSRPLHMEQIYLISHMCSRHNGGKYDGMAFFSGAKFSSTSCIVGRPIANLSRGLYLLCITSVFLKSSMSTVHHLAIFSSFPLLQTSTLFAHEFNWSNLSKHIKQN